MTTRTPVETRTPRMEPLARLPVFFALAGKRAVIAGGNAAAAWKAELLAAAGASVDVYAADPERRDARDRRAGEHHHSPPQHRSCRLRQRRARGRRVRGRRRSRRICRTRARRRRAGQCDRQACVLRFLLRRHRQPLAARHRHLDRRRSAGVRAGDPRQARSADPARLCGLGGGGARNGVRACRRSRSRSASGAVSGSASPSVRWPNPSARRHRATSMH